MHTVSIDRRNRTSRTRAAAIGTAVAALLTLVGCTTAVEPENSAPDSTKLLPEAEGKVDYPLVLDSPFGETVLEQRPERIAIVTASTLDTDALIALGGTPVFAPSTVERNPWLDAETVAEVETLWESEQGAEVSAEQVASADPDLIVALAAYETFDQGYFDRLSGIAPVLYASSEDLSWQQMTRELGATLDLARAADAAVGAAEERVARTRSEHPEFAGATAAHVIVYGQEWGAGYVSAPGTDTAELFEQLGFTLPEQAERFSEDDSISGELVGLIDADFLLISTFEEGTEDYFVDSPLFQTVPAVVEDRAVFNRGDQLTGINSFAWGLNVQSALSVPWLIDQLAEFGAQAIG